VRFVHEELVWIAAAAPVVAVAIHLIDRRRQRVLMERLGELPAVQRMMAARSPWRRTVKAVMFGLAVGLVLVAAARPQVAGVLVDKRKGLDVVIALDVSKSMLVGDVEVAQPKGGWTEGMDPQAPRPVPEDAEWVQGTRLERARQLLTSLAEELPDDRIGVTLFAGASIHFPLTDDGDLAVQLAHMIGSSDIMGGSDTGEALRVGTCLLRPDVSDPSLGCYGIGQRGTGGDPLPGEERRKDGKKPRPKVEEKEKEERGRAILVITDGGAPISSVATDVDAAQQLGIGIYFVGVGSSDGGVVPELDWEGKVVGPKRDASGQPVHSRLDRDSLLALAQLAGGLDHYVEVPAKGAFDVAPILEALAQVKRGELERIEHERPRDVYAWFLFPAFMLLVIEACIGVRRRVRHPEVAP
jgi:Ca-activated chloride channel family protein